MCQRSQTVTCGAMTIRLSTKCTEEVEDVPLVNYNRRWGNYCRVHGQTSDERLLKDAKNSPGRHLMGFIEWHRKRLEEFRSLNPGAFQGPTLVDVEAYDEWLDRYPPT